MGVSDELIMALADGELDAAAAANVSTQIRADTTARQKHALFRATRSLLSRAFDDVLEEPVPERLKERLKAGRRSADGTLANRSSKTPCACAHDRR